MKEQRARGPPGARTLSFRLLPRRWPVGRDKPSEDAISRQSPSSITRVPCRKVCVSGQRSQAAGKVAGAT